MQTTCVVKMNIDCEGCKQKVKKLLQKIDGVQSSTIDAEQGKVTVSGYIDPDTVVKELSKKGRHADLISVKQPSANNNNHHLLLLQQQQQNKKKMQLDDISGGKGGHRGGGTDVGSSWNIKKGLQDHDDVSELIDQVEEDDDLDGFDDGGGDVEEVHKHVVTEAIEGPILNKKGRGGGGDLHLVQIKEIAMMGGTNHEEGNLSTSSTGKGTRSNKGNAAVYQQQSQGSSSGGAGAARIRGVGGKNKEDSSVKKDHGNSLLSKKKHPEAVMVMGPAAAGFHASDTEGASATPINSSSSPPEVFAANSPYQQKQQQQPMGYGQPPMTANQMPPPPAEYTMFSDENPNSCSAM